MRKISSIPYIFCDKCKYLALDVDDILCDKLIMNKNTLEIDHPEVVAYPYNNKIQYLRIKEKQFILEECEVCGQDFENSVRHLVIDTEFNFKIKAFPSSEEEFKKEFFKRIDKSTYHELNKFYYLFNHRTLLLFEIKNHEDSFLFHYGFFSRELLKVFWLEKHVNTPPNTHNMYYFFESGELISEPLSYQKIFTVIITVPRNSL